MSANNGGFAFPVAYPAIDRGMTLRDYFAAKAMVVLLSSPEWRIQNGPQSTCKSAYSIADAMLAAREAK